MPKPNRKKLALSLLSSLPAMIAAGVWVYPRTQIENPALNLLASAFWGSIVGALVGVILTFAVYGLLVLYETYKEWLYDQP
jgi:hypothetical protein